jgi:tetratricopeptide (TPR) repeat protein
LNIKPKSNETTGDPVIDSVVSAKRFFEKNGSKFLTCCIIALAVLGGALIYSNIRNTNAKEAQDLFAVGVLDYDAEQYDKALESFSSVAADRKGTSAASMSAFMIGSIYLQRNDADQAIAFFKTAINGPKAGFVRGQALEGLAAAYEEKGDPASAIAYLEKALKDKAAAHRHAAIRWKLALLNKDNADKAISYCNAIVSDTTALAYRQKAENLLAVLNASKN